MIFVGIDVAKDTHYAAVSEMSVNLMKGYDMGLNYIIQVIK